MDWFSPFADTLDRFTMSTFLLFVSKRLILVLFSPIQSNIGNVKEQQYRSKKDRFSFKTHGHPSFSPFSSSFPGDRIGRRRALFLGMLLVQPLVIAGGFVSNYGLYVLLRLATCTCLVFGWIANHNIQLEYFSKVRGRNKKIFNTWLGVTFANCMYNI